MTGRLRAARASALARLRPLLAARAAARALESDHRGVGRVRGRGGLAAVLLLASWGVPDPSPGAAGAPGTLLAVGPEASADTVLVRIETELGPIVAELYPDQAPVTVANFLRYVDADAYRDARFHRTVREDNQPNDSIRIAVVQIGRNPETQRDPTFPAIPLERTSVLSSTATT